MTASRSYRLILAGMLPVIALLVYMEGQTYDPALIQFQSSLSQTDPALSFFPDRITEFGRIGQIRTFTKENLYEYVNGHAEYFISAGFSRLTVGEYGGAGTERGGPDAVVDIYDMEKSIQAFGILSDQSGGSTHTLQSGATGFRTQQSISFVKGQYYVRIAAYNENVSLDVFAQRIDDRISAGSDPFPEFSRLPDIGEVVQTRFVREAYRGLDFVNNVIEREYIVGGKKLQLFLVTGEEGDIKKLMRSFTDFFDQSEIAYDTIDRMGGTIYEVKDPFEGDWVLIPLSDSLFGIYSHYNDEIIDALLTLSGDR